MAIFGSFLGCVSRGLIVGPRNPQNRIPHEILSGYDFFFDSAHDDFFFDKLAQYLHVRDMTFLSVCICCFCKILRMQVINTFFRNFLTTIATKLHKLSDGYDGYG